MGRNIIEKIWDAHLVLEHPGHPDILAIDLMLIHEVTSAQAFQMLREKNLKVNDCGKMLATLDHSIPTRKNRLEIYDQSAKIQVETLRTNCKDFGIPLCDYDSGRQGVVHVIGPEMGTTQPGMTIVCGDSHTSTHGAFGALAFGIGTSEVAHVLATSCMLQKRPKTMKVVFNGKFNKGVYAKDAIIKLISVIGFDGATGYVIEYSGTAISKMSMEERMTVCNMTIECGARAGLIAPDQTTIDYIKGKAFAPKAADWDRAVQYWLSFQSDPDSKFDREVIINLDELQPMVTWGTNPSQAVDIKSNIPKFAELAEEQKAGVKRALEYTKLKDGQAIAGVPITWAFLGSCTNGRIEDLRIAAKILAGNKIHPTVTFYVVPGSEAVRDQAIKEGLDQIFIQAGADFRMPGCSMCLAMNDDKVPPGMRCISSSNRNFVGRQGPGSLTHLASPATVTASAIEGKITSAEGFI